jgi:hypothetical protein
MRTTEMALLLAGLLGGCAVNTAPSTTKAGVNPALTCEPMPVTQYLWGPAYQNMLNANVQPEWAYPVYVGLSTTGWAIGSIFAPFTDLLLLPLRAGSPCEG